MSIFGKIKDAIFGPDGGPFGDHYIGGKPKAATPAPAPAPKAAQPAPAPAPRPAAPAAAPAPAAPAPQPVDVEAVLSQKAAALGKPSNWRTSIVDLMILLGLDSSLHAREELATELGYTGPKGGSAEMNIWLHKQVMRKLAENGGKVPAELRD